MNWHAAVLSARSADTRPSIVITFDSAKYVFGCAEGASRAYHEGALRWARTRALFCARADARRAGGLAGLIMALSAGVPKIDVIGPPGLEYLLTTMRTYVYRSGIHINHLETPALPLNKGEEAKPVFVDKNVKVYSIPVFPEYTPAQWEEYDSPHHAPAGPEAGPSGAFAPTASVFSRPRHPEQSHSTPKPSFKRHRDGSPPSPNKRHKPFSSGMPRFSPRNRSSSGDDTVQEAGPSVVRGSPGAVEGQDTGKSNAIPSAGLDKVSAILGHMFPTKVDPLFSDLDYKPPPPPPKKPKKPKGTMPVPKEPEPVPAVPLGLQPRPRLPPRPLGFLDQLQPPFHGEGFAADGAPRAYGGPTMSWLVLGPKMKGKFDVEKAIELGVPNGPLRAKLVDGQTISFEVPDPDAPGEKKTVEVRSDQVVGPSEPPVANLILDCPSVDHIQPLVEQFADGSWFAKFRAELPEEHNLHVIFHMCGPAVLADPRYRAFMNSFPSDVEHVISSTDHDPNPATFVYSAAHQLVLHELDKEIFPLPKFTLTPPRPLAEFSDLPAKVTPMRSNLIISMRPAGPPEESPLTIGKDPFHPAATADPPLPLPESIRKPLEEAKLSVAAAAEARAGQPRQPGDDVQIITLGTGSAVPSRFRGVSGTLIRIPYTGSILLDAGEGTWGQMCRTFGTDPSQPDNVWEVLRNLRCIFVSHVHGDHQIGVPLILAKRAALNPPPRDPLWVLAGKNVLLHLREYAEIDDIGVNPETPGGVRLVNMEALHWKRTQPHHNSRRYQVEPWLDEYPSRLLAEDMCEALGLNRFSTVDMNHGCRCSGAVIDHRDGWRIVYSGDTRPTAQLAAAGAGATLLIHEATFSDDQLDYAQAKKHSTVGEALDIARQMGAKNTLLTHFSSRYPRVTPRTEAKAPSTLALAVDGARMRIGDMWKMPLYAPAMKQAISSGAAEDEDVPVQMMSW